MNLRGAPLTSQESLFEDDWKPLGKQVCEKSPSLTDPCSHDPPDVASLPTHRIVLFVFDSFAPAVQFLTAPVKAIGGAPPIQIPT